MTALRYGAMLIAANDFYTPTQCAERAFAVLQACAAFAERKADEAAAGDEPAPESAE